jgi:hypothetical protein
MFHQSKIVLVFIEAARHKDVWRSGGKATRIVINSTWNGVLSVSGLGQFTPDDMG